MMTAISFLDLAKEARSRGDRNGVLRAIKNHKRVKRKELSTLRESKARTKQYPTPIYHETGRF